MRIVLVHGFNVRDGGAETVDKLDPGLTALGHQVEKDEADYGYYDFWKVRFAKYSAVRRIAAALEHADVVITHSNGANYANMALKLLEYHRSTFKVIHFSPALNRNTPIPANVSKQWVFHTKTDYTVRLSAILPFHPWGNMGAGGYTGQDTRASNIDCSDLVRRHSDWFLDDNLDFFIKEIDAILGST